MISKIRRLVVSIYAEFEDIRVRRLTTDKISSIENSDGALIISF